MNEEEITDQLADMIAETCKRKTQNNPNARGDFLQCVDDASDGAMLTSEMVEGTGGSSGENNFEDVTAPLKTQNWEYRRK